jgi:peptidyl-prolyl cis-trans isomerase SurA
MGKFKFSILILLAATASLALQPKREVLFTVAGDPVYLDEFDYVYHKSNGNQEDVYSEASLKEYLELYINFRLKIKEALDLHMDTSKVFIDELAKYRKQAAQPYLSSKEVIDGLIIEAYERMKEEVRVSHLLIKTTWDADPADTLIAYKKIKGLKEKAESGIDFGKLAKSYSEDPSAAQNQGDLGYFSAFSMVYIFENIAFQTPEGKVSPIFRTEYGYHILKVNDRRPSTGKVKVAHIMIRANAGMDPEDSLAAKEKSQAIYKELKEGADWGKMVLEYSEDGYSKVKGGELEMMSVNSRIVPEFKERALKMQTVGEISEPIQTTYGWHIIKLIEREDLKSFDEMEPEIRNWVEKDGRSKISKTELVKKLKLENKFKEYPKNLEWLSTQVDSTIFDGQFVPAEGVKGYKKNLFSLNKTGFNSLNFLETLKLKRPRTDMTPAYFLKFQYPAFVKNSVIKYEEDHLDEKHYEFKMLMQEYHDGILMFNLMEEKIWNESTRDTAGLEAYFLNNQDQFQWGKRVEAWVFDCKNEKILNLVDQELKSGLFSVSRPIRGEYFYDYRSTDLKDNDLNILLARLKVIGNKRDLRATIIVHSYAKESYGKFKSLGSDRLEKIKSKIEELDLPLDAIEFVDAGTKEHNKDLEKARSIEVLFHSVNPKDLQAFLNKENPLSLNVRTGKFEKGDNQFLDQLDWEPGIYTVKNENRTVRIKIFGAEDPRPKKLDEVKGEAISGYQDFLETQWIKNLRNTYPVVENEEVFQSLIKTNP